MWRNILVTLRITLCNTLIEPIQLIWRLWPYFPVYPQFPVEIQTADVEPPHYSLRILIFKTYIVNYIKAKWTLKKKLYKMDGNLHCSLPFSAWPQSASTAWPLSASSAWPPLTRCITTHSRMATRLLNACPLGASFGECLCVCMCVSRLCHVVFT